MSIGIVVEYNPLHNGHLYQINWVKQHYPNEALVAVMSGNWLQRGEPAAFDKWTRTKMALAAGIDLVIELPSVFAVSPADSFGFGAIKCLNALGVSRVVCGAEHPALDFLALAAQTQKIKLDVADQSTSYAQAYADAVNEATNHQVVSPNDMLALSYARAILAVNPSIELTPMQRIVAGYHDEKLDVSQVNGQKIASATAVRAALINNQSDVWQFLPPSSQKLLANKQVVSWNDFFPLLAGQLINHSPEQLSDVYGMNEGLEYRFCKQMYQFIPSRGDYEAFFKQVKSKRYTYTKIARQAVWILLNVTKHQAQLAKANPAIRILGFNSRGQTVLNHAKKTTSLPLLTKVTTKKAKKIIPVDLRAGQVYSLINHTFQDIGISPIRFTERCQGKTIDNPD